MSKDRPEISPWLMPWLARLTRRTSVPVRVISTMVEPVCVEPIHRLLVTGSMAMPDQVCMFTGVVMEATTAPVAGSISRSSVPEPPLKEMNRWPLVGSYRPLERSKLPARASEAMTAPLVGLTAVTRSGLA